MMRRLTYMFAAGLVAAATALTTVGAAGASAATAGPRTGCQIYGSWYLSVTKTGVNYYLGTPNNTGTGVAAFLKPATNGTTFWTFCQDTSAPGEFALYNRNLVLSASRTTDQNVTMQHAGNLGAGFALQRWVATWTSTGVILSNVRTGQYLRVRNSGPTMGQTVTTGFSSRNWILTP